MPCAETVDLICVISSPAVNVLTRSTVTWVRLFPWPVVVKTINANSGLGKISSDDMLPSREAELRRSVVNAGRLASRLIVSKALRREPIFVLPSYPEIWMSTSNERS